MAMASINILCQIMEMYKSKSVSFEDLLYTDISGMKQLPLVLSIDELEVHLHPYLQRSLIGYYKRILRNEDPEFSELMKIFFGVDGIDGQLIIVTHSTDALIGDYRNLIRYYKNGDKTTVVSGYALRPIEGTNNEGRIKTEIEKHPNNAFSRNQRGILRQVCYLDRRRNRIRVYARLCKQVRNIVRRSWNLCDKCKRRKINKTSSSSPYPVCHTKRCHL